MALRSLPALGLRLLKGPRIGPVHALSPAAGSRLMGTEPHGRPTNLPCSAAEQRLKTNGEGQIVYSKEEMLAKLRESVNVMYEEVLKKQEMLRQDIAAYEEDTRHHLDNLSRSTNTISKLSNACIAVVLGISVLMIGSKYGA